MNPLLFPDGGNPVLAAGEYINEAAGRRRAEREARREEIGNRLLQTWPAEMARAAMGAVTLPGDVYAGRVDPMSDEAIGRAAELAGLVTLGSAAMPAPRGALTMGAARRVDDLPMDEASRMARAREMGFTTDAYHGTRSDFDQFGRIDGGNAYGQGYYFTTDPDAASRYATGEGVNRITLEGDAGPNVMPVKLRMESTFQNRQVLTRQELNRLEKAANEVQPGYFKRGELARTFDRAYPPVGDNVLYQLPNVDPAQILRRAGYDSMNTDMGIVVFEPSQIRSRFSRFDPAKAESGSLLAGIAPIGVAGAALASQDDEP